MADIASATEYMNRIVDSTDEPLNPAQRSRVEALERARYVLSERGALEDLLTLAEWILDGTRLLSAEFTEHPDRMARP